MSEYVTTIKIEITIFLKNYYIYALCSILRELHITISCFTGQQVSSCHLVNAFVEDVISFLIFNFFFFTNLSPLLDTFKMSYSKTQSVIILHVDLDQNF